MGRTVRQGVGRLARCWDDALLVTVTPVIVGPRLAVLAHCTHLIHGCADWQVCLLSPSTLSGPWNPPSRSTHGPSNGFDQ